MITHCSNARTDSRSNTFRAGDGEPAPHLPSATCSSYRTRMSRLRHDRLCLVMPPGITGLVMSPLPGPPARPSQGVMTTVARTVSDWTAGSYLHLVGGTGPSYPSLTVEADSGRTRGARHRGVLVLYASPHGGRPLWKSGSRGCAGRPRTGLADRACHALLRRSAQMIVMPNSGRWPFGYLCGVWHIHPWFG